MNEYPGYRNGLSGTAKRFLTALAALLFAVVVISACADMSCADDDGKQYDDQNRLIYQETSADNEDGSRTVTVERYSYDSEGTLAEKTVSQKTYSSEDVLLSEKEESWVYGSEGSTTHTVESTTYETSEFYKKITECEVTASDGTYLSGSLKEWSNLGTFTTGSGESQHYVRSHEYSYGSDRILLEETNQLIYDSEEKEDQTLVYTYDVSADGTELDIAYEHKYECGVRWTGTVKYLATDEDDYNREYHGRNYTLTGYIDKEYNADGILIYSNQQEKETEQDGGRVSVQTTKHYSDSGAPTDAILTKNHYDADGDRYLLQKEFTQYNSDGTINKSMSYSAVETWSDDDGTETYHLEYEYLNGIKETGTSAGNKSSYLIETDSLKYGYTGTLTKSDGADPAYDVASYTFLDGMTLRITTTYYDTYNLEVGELVDENGTVKNSWERKYTPAESEGLYDFETEYSSGATESYIIENRYAYEYTLNLSNGFKKVLSKSYAEPYTRTETMSDADGNIVYDLKNVISSEDNVRIRTIQVGDFTVTFGTDGKMYDSDGNVIGSAVIKNDGSFELGSDYNDGEHYSVSLYDLDSVYLGKVEIFDYILLPKVETDMYFEKYIVEVYSSEDAIQYRLTFIDHWYSEKKIVSDRTVILETYEDAVNVSTLYIAYDMFMEVIEKYYTTTVSDDGGYVMTETSITDKGKTYEKWIYDSEDRMTGYAKEVFASDGSGTETLYECDYREDGTLGCTFERKTYYGENGYSYLSETEKNLYDSEGNLIDSSSFKAVQSWKVIEGVEFSEFECRYLSGLVETWAAAGNAVTFQAESDLLWYGYTKTFTEYKDSDPAYDVTEYTFIDGMTLRITTTYYDTYKLEVAVLIDENGAVQESWERKYTPAGTEGLYDFETEYSSGATDSFVNQDENAGEMTVTYSNGFKKVTSYADDVDNTHTEALYDSDGNTVYLLKNAKTSDGVRIKTFQIGDFTATFGSDGKLYDSEGNVIGKAVIEENDCIEVDSAYNTGSQTTVLLYDPDSEYLGKVVYTGYLFLPNSITDTYFEEYIVELYSPEDVILYRLTFMDDNYDDQYIVHDSRITLTTYQGGIEVSSLNFGHDMFMDITVNYVTSASITDEERNYERLVYGSEGRVTEDSKWTYASDNSCIITHSEYIYGNGGVLSSTRNVKEYYDTDGYIHLRECEYMVYDSEGNVVNARSYTDAKSWYEEDGTQFIRYECRYLNGLVETQIASRDADTFLVELEHQKYGYTKTSTEYKDSDPAYDVTEYTFLDGMILRITTTYYDTYKLEVGELIGENGAVRESWERRYTPAGTEGLCDYETEYSSGATDSYVNKDESTSEWVLTYSNGFERVISYTEDGTNIETLYDKEGNVVYVFGSIHDEDGSWMRTEVQFKDYVITLSSDGKVYDSEGKLIGSMVLEKDKSFELGSSCNKGDRYIATLYGLDSEYLGKMVFTVYQLVPNSITDTFFEKYIVELYSSENVILYRLTFVNHYYDNAYLVSDHSSTLEIYEDGSNVMTFNLRNDMFMEATLDYYTTTVSEDGSYVISKINKTEKKETHEEWDYDSEDRITRYHKTLAYASGSHITCSTHYAYYSDGGIHTCDLTEKYYDENGHLYYREVRYFLYGLDGNKVESVSFTESTTWTRNSDGSVTVNAERTYLSGTTESYVSTGDAEEYTFSSGDRTNSYSKTYEDHEDATPGYVVDVFSYPDGNVLTVTTTYYDTYDLEKGVLCDSSGNVIGSYEKKLTSDGYRTEYSTGATETETTEEGGQTLQVTVFSDGSKLSEKELKNETQYAVTTSLKDGEGDTVYAWGAYRTYGSDGNLVLQVNMIDMPGCEVCFSSEDGKTAVTYDTKGNVTGSMTILRETIAAKDGYTEAIRSTFKTYDLESNYLGKHVVTENVFYSFAKNGMYFHEQVFEIYSADDVLVSRTTILTQKYDDTYMLTERKVTIEMFEEGVKVSTRVITYDSFKELTDETTYETFTVTFDDGTVQTEVRYTYGDASVEAPAITEKTGQTAVWEAYTLGHSDITVKAVYSWIYHEAVFYNGDEVFTKVSAHYGEEITVPAEYPAKEADENHSYVFAYWSGFTTGMTMGNEDMSFKAVYNSFAVPKTSGSSSEYTIGAASSTSETLSSESVNSLIAQAKADSSTKATIVLSNGSISLDSTAISNLRPEDATASIEKVKDGEVPEAGKAISNILGTYDISIGDNHDFKGGKLTFRMYIGNYTGKATIYHLDAEGKSVAETFNVISTNGEIVFTVGSLSKFIIAEAEDEDNGNTAMMTVLAAFVAAVAILCSTALVLRRQKA